jgi:segregation and condensation protein B
MTKEDLNKDLSPASLETLSIIAYKGLVTRKEIEYIRGVNSSFSLRALLMRGLIERESSQLDERIFLYKPSTEMLRYMGIKRIEDLPEWKSVQTEIKKIEVQEEVHDIQENQDTR